MADSKPRRPQDRSDKGHFLSAAETGGRRSEAFSSKVQSNEALGAIDQHDWSGGSHGDPFASLKAAGPSTSAGVHQTVPRAWGETPGGFAGRKQPYGQQNGPRANLGEFVARSREGATHGARLRGANAGISVPAASATAKGPVVAAAPRAAEPTPASPHVGEAESRRPQTRAAKQQDRWGTMGQYRDRKAAGRQARASQVPGVTGALARRFPGAPSGKHSASAGKSPTILDHHDQMVDAAGKGPTETRSAQPWSPWGKTASKPRVR